MKSKKILKFSLILVIVFCIGIIFAKGYLVVNEPAKKSDVIIVLSGGEGRLEKGAELYREGYGEYVILTNANAEFTTLDEAISLGIPEERIILEEKATSTYTNATYTKPEMETRLLQSAIVVSSDYHMKRTKLTFDRVFQDTEIELTYVASPSNEVLGDYGFRTTFRESIKYVGYLLGLYKFIDLEE